MSHEKTIGTVRSAFDEVFGALDARFNLPLELLNLRTSVSRWTIAEILEHVHLTNHFLLIIIRRHTEKALAYKAAGRQVPDGESDLEKLEPVGVLESFPWPRPEHMEPEGTDPLAVVREKLAEDHRTCMSLLHSMMAGEGALVKVSMSVNGLGQIDMYQWLYFLALHGTRHLAQIKRIQENGLFGTDQIA